MPGNTDDYEVNYYVLGSSKHRVNFYFTPVPSPSAFEVTTVNGRPVSSYYEVSDELNYETVDHEGQIYEQTKCFYLNSRGPGQNLCWVEIDTDRLRTILCSEGGWLKVTIPASNDVRTAEGRLPISDSSPEIPVSQIEPADGQEELDNCLRAKVIAQNDEDDEDECAPGEVLEGDECVPEGGSTCPAGEVLNEDGECEPDEGDLRCMEDCAPGFVCDIEVGECVPAEPEGSLCADMECEEEGQYCNNETGECEYFDFELPPEGTGSGSNNETNNQNEEPEPLTGVACAFNPSQCADSKGWCQLNPSAPFNPLVLILLLGLPTVLWFRRTV